MKKKIKYPYSEGETYYTTEGNKVIKSYWDCGSEEMHTGNKQYFDTEKEALLFIELNKIAFIQSVCQESLEKIAFNKLKNKTQEAKQCLECIAVYK